MTELPLVSICVTCYNHEKYVRQALESAINQTYPNIEILISDDGSTDRTRDIILEIIELHPEKKIRTFFSESNTAFGVVEELDQAFVGKYMAGFSGDDYWGETAVAQYVEFMEAHEEYAASFSVPNVVLEVQNDISDFWGQNMSRYELFELLFCRGNRICAPSMFVRTDMWRSMGCWKYQYRQLQDYEKWLAVLQKYDIHFFEKGVVPVYYRIHGNNLSNINPENMQRDLMERTYILYRQMEDMTQDFFVRAFQKQLVYPVGSEHFCLNCEKLIVMLQAPAVPLNSVIFYYFTHIDDADFSLHIERDYRISRKVFWEMTGQGQELLNRREDCGDTKRYRDMIEKQNHIIEELMNKLQTLLKL